jgi:hypothetical protein
MSERDQHGESFRELRGKEGMDKISDGQRNSDCHDVDDRRQR